MNLDANTIFDRGRFARFAHFHLNEAQVRHRDVGVSRKGG